MKRRFCQRDIPFLSSLYWDENLSLSQMAERLGVHKDTVHRSLIRLNIPRRDYGQATKLLLARPEVKQKLSQVRSGKGNPRFGCKWSQKEYEKLLPHLSNFWRGEDNPFFGRTHTLETRAKIARTVSAQMKQRWQNPLYRAETLKKWFSSGHKKPNKKEGELIQLIEANRLPFKYTGDGSFVIGGYLPDFVNCNGAKQIIELFGEYWHRRPKIPWHQTELGRIMAYASFGYKTLVVWEDELKQPDEVIAKIRQFMKGDVLRPQKLS